MNGVPVNTLAPAAPSSLARLARLSLSRVIAELARVERPRVLVQAFIRAYARWHGIDLQEFVPPSPSPFYASFRDFHARAHKPGARPIDVASRAVFPADGFVLAAGVIRAGRVGQVKGIDYDLATLLGPGGETQASRLEGGRFVNVYLPVPDCHRLCAPIDCVLRRETYLRGDCLSLGLRSLARRRDVFVTNERLVQELASPDLDVVLVAVGGIAATNITSTRPRDVAQPHYRKGDELGAFWLGSTIVVLLPPGIAVVPLVRGQHVRLGEPLIR